MIDYLLLLKSEVCKYIRQKQNSKNKHTSFEGKKFNASFYIIQRFQWRENTNYFMIQTVCEFHFRTKLRFFECGNTFSLKGNFYIRKFQCKLYFNSMEYFWSIFNQNLFLLLFVKLEVKFNSRIPLFMLKFSIKWTELIFRTLFSSNVRNGLRLETF